MSLREIVRVVFGCKVLRRAFVSRMLVMLEKGLEGVVFWGGVLVEWEVGRRVEEEEEEDEEEEVCVCVCVCVYAENDVES